MATDRNDEYIPTDSVREGNRLNHYQIVVLRDDQWDKVREIVREEISRSIARGKAGLRQ